MAKMNNVATALEIARACRDILGANGILDEYQAGRHMVNLETDTPTKGPTTCTSWSSGRKSPGSRPIGEGLGSLLSLGGGLWDPVPFGLTIVDLELPRDTPFEAKDALLGRVLLPGLFFSNYTAIE